MDVLNIKKIIAKEGLFLFLVIVVAIAISNFVGVYQGLLIGNGFCRVSPADNFYLRSSNLDTITVVKYGLGIMTWKAKIIGTLLIVLFYLLIRFIFWAVKILKEK